MASPPSQRRVRRVLYEGDLKGDDYRDMHAEALAIRRELSALRHRLHMLGKKETHFDFDSRALACAGALDCAIVNLHGLVDGERWDLGVRAARVDDLWAKAEADPDAYVIEPGTSYESEQRRRWAA